MSTVSEDAAIDVRPERAAVGLTTLLALAVLLLLAFVPSAAAVAAIGVLFLGVGTARANERLASLGLVALLGGVALGGLYGLSPVVLLLATAAALVAWDASAQAIDLGRMLGHEAESRRALYVHVAVTTGVTVLATGVGYLVFTVVVAEELPVAALVLLLVGGVVLAVALR